MNFLYFTFPFTVLSCVLSYLPLFLKLEIAENYNLDISTDINGMFAALLISVAVSFPMALDLLLDVLNFQAIQFNKWEPYWISKFFYVAALLIPDFLILVFAIPNSSTECIIFLVNNRNSLLALGIYGLLWESHKFFHSVPAYLVFLLFTIEAPLSSLGWFRSNFPAASVLQLLTEVLGLVFLIYTLLAWWLHSSKINTSKLSPFEIRAHAVVISLAAYVLLVTIYPFVIDTKNVSKLLAVTTFGEVGFTVTLWLLQHRILLYEVYEKQASLDMKRNFVRIVSHEIRTPLNSVFMGLELMRSESMTREGTDTLNDIKSAVEVSIEILNDLLCYEKLEQGIMVLETSKFKASNFILETLRPFLMQARKMGIDLQLPTSTSKDFQMLHYVIIHGDQIRLGQVLRNLVSNSLKFTPSGGSVTVTAAVVRKKYFGDNKINPSVSAELETLSEGSSPTNTCLRIRVRDTGVGMSNENQKKLFKQIIQFNPGKLQNGGGSGLGLWITKAIVDLHNGHIDVYSEGEGLGSTFILDLPIDGYDAAVRSRGGAACDGLDDLAVISPDSSQHQPSYHLHSSLHHNHYSAPELPSVEYPPNTNEEIDFKSVDTTDVEEASRPVPILVVDDSPMNRSMLRKLLHRLDYPTVEAEDGLIALGMVLDSLRDHQPLDVVLMDYQMPNMDGPFAAKAMREAGFEGLIIGITGNGLQKDIDEYISHGADKVMIKPVDISTLKQAIVERRQRQLHENN